MSTPDCVTFEHEAMATRWRISIAGQESSYARQAAEAAFDEIDRLENELSRFKDTTDVAELNSLPANTPAVMGLDAFECLKIADQLHTLTSGVFDVTIGRLFKCWMAADGNPRQPSDEELELASSLSGFDLLELNDADHTVSVRKEGVQVDLGGVGKGYALDCAADLLSEWDIDRALLDSGGSTIRAVGAPLEADGWPIGLGKGRRLALKDRCMAASGFDVKGAHIVNPLNGQAVDTYSRSWAFADNSAIADGLSTAFMMMTHDEILACCESLPLVGGVVLPSEGEELVYFGSIQKSDLLSCS